MTYESYISISREALLAKMETVMPEKRLRHCLGVEKAARELAERFGLDVEKAGLAGLLHDYAKKVSDEEFLALIDKYKLNPDLKNWGNNVWHGMVGIYKIQEDLGVKDAEILRAIEIHTVGSSTMSELDKVVYVADYIEHNRDFPGVDKARAVAQSSCGLRNSKDSGAFGSQGDAHLSADLGNLQCLCRLFEGNKRKLKRNYERTRIIGTGREGGR